jgi:DNA-binding beta-propeller fold protein YncE
MFAVRKTIACGIAVVAAGAVLSTVGASPQDTGAAAAATRLASAGSAGTSPGTAASGSRLWIARYNGPPGTDNVITSMAVSPDGTRVFVTGNSAKAGQDPREFATVGYKTATGARLWARHYRGAGSLMGQARSVAISPDGKTVFVTGTINMQSTDADFATIAYNAATGAVRWTARYDGPGKVSDDAAYAVAASPNGKTVFVTGGSGGGYTTIAYRAGTGTRQWIAHYKGSGGHAVAVAVSPGGGKVIITGTNGRDYGTVAYRTVSGARLWARHHAGPAGFREYGGATALAFSPGGSTVFVTGDVHSPGTPSGTGYATIAYRTADGAQLWATSDGPLASTGGAAAVAVSPDGRTVFVTGHDTVAYRAATGAQLWASLSLGGYPASALAVSPDGRTVFITGPVNEPTAGNNMRPVFTAAAFGAATGTQLWVNHYRGPSLLGGYGQTIAVSPGGHRVYVAGFTVRSAPHRQVLRYTVIAYRT